MGRHGEALALDEKTLETRRRVMGSEHPATLRTATGLAVRLGEVGRVEEAVVLGEETLEVQRRVVGPEHSDTLKSVEMLEWLERRRADDRED
ncbi:tetratricopeptide repeat protein [Streptomyces sp. NBC_00019]|uniref:tetratricopeptide repeat protein n=1 Tax=Streptomyces sp. NBC_00019 TaxID=2975623 RepID=UPI00386DB256